MIRFFHAAAWRARRTPIWWFVLVTGVVALLYFLLAGFIPLHASSKLEFLSGYGVSDNRRLLLRYGALLAAIALGPLAALWLLPRRWRTSWRQSPGAATADLVEALEPRAAGLALDHLNRPPATQLAVGKRRRHRLRDAAGLLALGALLLFLFVGPGVAYHPLNGHELVHLGYLNEIDHGRLLDVETRVTYGPLLGYSIYLFMKAVSFSLVGFRLYWNVLTAVFLFLLLWAAGKRFRRRGFLVLFALYAILWTSARYYLPDARGVNGGFWGWGNVGRHGWVALALLLLAGPLLRIRAAWPRFLIGAFLVIGIFYAQETAVSAPAALASLVLLAGWNHPRRARRAELLAIVVGAVFTGLLILAPVILRRGLGEFFRDALLVPLLFARGAGNAPYPPLFGHPGGLMAALPAYLLPALILGLLLTCWILFLRWEVSVLIELPLAIFGALSYVSALIRVDPAHLLNISLTPILLSFLLLDRFAPRPAPRTARRPASARWRPAVPMVLAALPLLLLHPGLPELGRGLAGRILHPSPAPPPGWKEIALLRAGIWTPADNWFDDRKWGDLDDVETVRMIQVISQGRETFIIGNKASLYYFLADVPAASPYTDMSSQCFTSRDREDMLAAVHRRRPDYVFVMKGFDYAAPTGDSRYHFLGSKHNFLVFQRDELTPADVPAPPDRGSPPPPPVPSGTPAASRPAGRPPEPPPARRLPGRPPGPPSHESRWSDWASI